MAKLEGLDGYLDQLPGTRPSRAPGGSLVDYLDELDNQPAPPPAPAPAGVLRTIGDMGVKVGQGVVDLGQAVVGVGSLATGGAVGKGMRAIGYDPERAKEMIGQGLSDAQRASDAKVQQAEGFGDTVMSAIENPRAIAGSVAQSIPGMLAAGGLSGAAARLIAMRAAAPLGGLGTEAGAAAGKAAIEAAAGKLMWAGAAAEGAQSAGQIADQAQGAGRSYGQYAPAALAAGLGTAVIGRTAGRLMGDAETALFTGAKAAGVQGSLPARVAKGVVGEGLLEEMPQSAQEQAFTNMAMGDPLSKGVGNAAAMGALTGAAMGGGAAAISPHHAADEVRATTTVPEVGVLSAAANVGTETEAQTIENSPPVVIPAAEPDPVDPVMERIKTLRGKARTEALAAYNMINRPDVPKGVRQYNSKLLDKHLGTLDEEKTPLLTYDTTPTGTMVAGPDGVRHETRADLINRAQLQAEQDAEAQRRIDLGMAPAHTKPAQAAINSGANNETDPNRASDSAAVATAPAVPGDGQPIEVAGQQLDKDWTAFAPESGTLNVPRADMPQVKAEHRGAMVNFLNARGIAHTQEEVPASSLKPTQAEFSPARVLKAEGFTGTDRSILVSSDGHVLDGHHQWLAKLKADAPVKVIRLNAPVAELIAAVKEFPSSTQAEGSKPAAAPAAAPATEKQGAFATVEEAQAYISQQRRAGGARIEALPLPLEDGTFRIAMKDSADYPAAEAFRKQLELQAAGVQHGDIVTNSGNPFKAKLPATRAAKQAGDGHVVVPVKGGFVVRKDKAEPATSTVDVKGIMKSHTDANGAVNGKAATDAIVAEVKKALDAGKSVTLIAENKPHVITGIQRGMMQDDKGQRWGTLILMTDNDGKNRLEIGGKDAQKPAATPATPAPAKTDSAAPEKTPKKRVSKPADDDIPTLLAKDVDAGAFARYFGPASGMTVADVRKITNEITASWEGGPPIIVVDKASDLPGTVDRRARGLYDGKAVYIVASNNVNADMVARTVAHEAVAHHGLRQVLGKDGFDQLMRDIRRAIKHGNKPLTALQEYVKRAYKDQNLTADEIADEVAARAVEQGVDPATGEFKPGFAFLKKVYAQIARFLRGVLGRHGRKIPFTVSELHGILQMALESLQAGPLLDGGGQLAVAARSDNPVTVPPVAIGGALGTGTTLPDYAAAKAGDTQAAVKVAKALVTDDLVNRVKTLIGDAKPTVVPILSEEATGRNQIPAAAALVLSNKLGLETTADIVQSNRPHRTTLSGLDRIFAGPEFDGKVEPGRSYLLVDDTLTQGATFASLASHIEDNGGIVVGAVALTGKPYSAELQPQTETLAKLREKHGDIEQDFRAATGYGFDALTQSEARYLASFKPAQAIRDRIAAEAQRAVDGRDADDAGRALALDAPRAAPVALQPLKTPVGTAFQNNSVVLAKPRLNVKQPSGPLTRIDYEIRDPVMFAEARERMSAAAARDASTVGVLTMDVDKDGVFKSLRNIEVFQSKRGTGMASQVVGSILETLPAGAKLHIHDILPTAVGFWDKLGAKFPRSEDGMEALLTPDQFRSAYASTATRASGEEGQAGKPSPSVHASAGEGRPADDGQAAETTQGTGEGQIKPRMALDAPADDPRDPLTFSSKLRDAYNDLAGTRKTFSWWNNTVGTQYQKAHQDKHFKRVFDATQDYILDVSRLANDAADRARDLLPRLDNLRDVLKDTPLDKDRTSKADVKAIAKPLFQGTLVDKRRYDAEELKRVFKLNDKQVDLYKQFRAAVDKSLDDLTASTVAKLMQYKGFTTEMKDALEVGDHAAMAKMAEDAVKLNPGMKGMADQVREVSDRAMALKREGYAPLMRFGQYAVSVRDPKTKDLQAFYLFESERAANKKARELEGSGVVEQSVMAQEDYKLLRGVSPESLELFGDILEKAGVFDAKDEVFQQYLRQAVDQRSAMKRMIQREGYPGYSQDVRRVLATFVTSNARLASKNLHFSPMLEAVENIPKSKGDVRDEATKLVDYVQNPVEEASKIRGLLFAQYIGGSVASAMVNMTQSFTMTLPYLSQFSNPAKAAGQIAGAMKQALGKISDKPLAADLAKAEQAGVVSPQEIHHLNAEAMATFGSNPAVQKVMFLWGGLFSLAEQYNRRVAFIAAWNGAKERGEADPYAAAVKAVEETQGVYNKGNRPDWARGALGATLFTFKQFSISYLEFLSRLPTRERVLALAILMLASGAEGLPFADDLDDVIDTIAQRLDYNFNSKQQKRQFIGATLGQGAADFLLKGVSSIPGMPIDIAARMGMANLVPGSGILRKDVKDHMQDVLEIAGPAGGVVRDATQGQFLPVAIRNLIKGADMFQSGAYKDQAGRRVVDVDAVDAMWKSIGFQPIDVAKDSLARRVVNQSNQLLKDTESEIAADMAQARIEQDPAAMEAARARLRDWNEKNPETPISINSGQINRRVRQARLTATERMLKTTPKEARQNARELLN
ncbi:hypothetical protein D9M73_50910 [compost metagenome]